MWEREKYKNGQSMIEYAVLICVVISAILLMSIYVKRAYSGRIKADADSISSRLYSPKHTTSLNETAVYTQSESCTGKMCNTVPGLVGGGAPVPENISAEWTKTEVITGNKEAVDAFARE